MKNHSDLYLVGGFLGSGKTTAIIQASHNLISRGSKVGVITNDQGKYLVDTAFFKLESIPAVEVTGGCFCCNYDDLNDHIIQLMDEISPDIIFAESVGSCADIVATVIKPLISLGDESIEPKNFSVFVDGRLLLMWLEGIPMPFSEDVVYIFEQQMEESGLLVVNKRDLLEKVEIDLISSNLPARFPGKPFIFQNSLSDEDVNDWVGLLRENKFEIPVKSLDIDYVRYGIGEAKMAWLDQKINLSINNGNPYKVLLTFFEEVLTRLNNKNIGIGHLKFVVNSSDVHAKISFTNLLDRNWESQIPRFSGKEISLLVNARVETSAEELRNIIGQTLDSLQSQFDLELAESDIDFFHPDEPKPTHRYK